MLIPLAMRSSGQFDLIQGSSNSVNCRRPLHAEGGSLFGDALFADLFKKGGRPSVPPRIVATVMVLQRLFGLSDREAVE